MPNDQNSSQGRRPHYHRGRRGGDRRGTERRTPPNTEAGQRSDHVEVEQIMREIRSRIAKRHGIDFSPQQIQELAARRLEAILEPRHVKPALMEQMRRAAGEPIEVPAPPQGAPSGFQEGELYESHRGIIRLLRKWLNPILMLFFNPTPIARALDAQAQRNNEAAAREAELYARQAEWNALHYELLQRLVTEVSRNSLEVQALAMRVESLATRVDFNERRVRSIEGTGHQPSQRPPRSVEAAPQVEPRQPATATTSGDTPQVPLGSGDVPAAAAPGGDGTKRRRRRRRGRRSGAGAAGDAGLNAADPQASGADGDSDIDNDTDADDGDVPVSHAAAPDAPAAAAEPPAALEPAHAFSLLQPVEHQPPIESAVLDTPAAPEPPALDTAPDRPAPAFEPPTASTPLPEPAESPAPEPDERREPGPHER